MQCQPGVLNIVAMVVLTNGDVKRRVVDLRSDTTTVPTAEMLASVATAELGDDVYGAFSASADTCRAMRSLLRGYPNTPVESCVPLVMGR